MTLSIHENQDSLKEFFLEFLGHYSPSGNEMGISKWLVEKMKAFSFDRAHSDEVHNAIGEIGPLDAPNHIVCLGHIDTVNGELPIKFDGEAFWGRGAVDAKGPFANFMLGALKFKKTLEEYNAAAAPDKMYKLIIIGAVEEEAVTSKGAHHVCESGFLKQENLRAIIIGEPSDYRKITLGYKGRWVFEITAEAPRTHTAHANMGAAEMLINIYNLLNEKINVFNRDKGIFHSHQLHIRSIEARNDNVQDMDSDKAVIKLAVRGGPDFDMEEYENFLKDSIEKVKELVISQAIDPLVVKDVLEIKFETFAFDAPIVSAKTTPLVKAFLRAMRANEIEPKFSYKTGTSDMNVLGARLPNVPILTYGPGDSKLDHTKEEHLYLDHLVKSSEVLSRVFYELLPKSD